MKTTQILEERIHPIEEFRETSQLDQPLNAQNASKVLFWYKDYANSVW